tara:strand:+ start:3093 stop:3500 length:408 start_codon:yes stop_codon:yes gene_type:complete
MKAKYSDKATISGWKFAKPHTPAERKEMLDKYGKRCYLLPEEMKYPVCDKNDGEYDCRGIRSSIFWAQTHHKLSQKKKRLEKRFGKTLKKTSLKKTSLKRTKSKTLKRKLSHKDIFNKGVKLGKNLGCSLQNRTI